MDKAEFLPVFIQARIQAFSDQNIRSGFAAAGLVPLDPDRVLSTLQIRPLTPPEVPLQEPWQPGTPHNPDQTELQYRAIKAYLQRRSKTPPSPTDAAIKQLLKGAQIAMHRAALYKDEAEKMRAVHERRKRKTKQRYISKQQTLSVAEAQSLIQGPIQGPTKAVVEPIQQLVDLGKVLLDKVPPGNRFGLPSYFICRGFDHTTSECLKYK